MVSLSLAAQTGSKGAVQCPMVKVQAERLADLNIPRNGHSVLCVNGEPTVIGGHTTNFVPTPTLEYYKDGKWNVVPMAFTHDDGCAVQLTTGKVLILGGHEKNMGIGQSFEAEFYDPETRTCEGFASTDTKRAMPSALALDSGRAVISGNWYHKDAIELYDGNVTFQHVKEVSIGRSTPHILRTAPDNAIILSGTDTTGQQLTLPVADQLRGEPYRVPLLETWQLMRCARYWPSSHYFIGDEAQGDYSYLLPIHNDKGEIAIARVTNGEFSLLPTDVPIPLSCQWGKIIYYVNLLADREHQRAYLICCDSIAVSPCDTTPIYVISIDYASTPAHVTLYYTDVLTDVDITNPLLTDDGDLMLVGGTPQGSYFKPTAATWLIHLAPQSKAAATAWSLWWRWLLAALALAALAAWLLMRTRDKRKTPKTITPEPAAAEELYAVVPDVPVKEAPVETPLMEEVPVEDTAQVLSIEENDNTQLMHHICQVIEEKRLYLDPNLKMTDIAKMLGVSRNSISNCINSQRDCSFPQFVNAYRVTHAQELLRDHPDLKIAEVWMAAGFSSEASFYRIFKSITGSTPTEWRNSHSQNSSTSPSR